MTDLPNIGKLAIASLATVGMTDLEDLATIDETNLKKLHGLGPKTIGILKESLAKQKRALSQEDSTLAAVDFVVRGDLACNNAPKRQYLRDAVVSYYGRIQASFKDLSTADIAVDYVGSGRLIHAKSGTILAINLLQILSHGKAGASYGQVVNKEGEVIDFAWFVSFESHKKSARINQITIFESKKG